ncbi:MAG: hypothetical protein PHY05_09495 [Methanothrix sp.]|nr:hypothetical protein [Methanothrix sp.]
MLHAVRTRSPNIEKRWLFSRHCDFLEAGHTCGRERENVINKARVDVDVIEELFGLSGQQMILELIHNSEDPYLAGWALGKSRILEGQARNLLENLESKCIEDGICAGVFNGRRCVMRSIGEGSIQERTVSKRYRNFSCILSDSWPRIASVMKKIEGEYEAFARDEDNRAELDEDLYK